MGLATGQPASVIELPACPQVWNCGGCGVRIVLLVDLWHPALTEAQKASLSPLPFSSSSAAAAGAVLDVAGEWVVEKEKSVGGH